MVDIKKFLDQEGLKQLWAKINMQDYPNNDTLMAVINAIDETKADREEVVSLRILVDQNSLTEEDAIKMAMETGLLPFGIPVAEEDEVYTDETGAIYIL